MKHTISVLVENQSGVLARISGLFSARGFNIDSLAVGETEDPTVSRMTIVSQGDDRVVEQIMKQLDKLVDVIQVRDLSESEMIERELVLVKLAVGATKRSELMQIVNTFRAKVVDVNPKSLTVEVTGSQSKLDAMLELLRPFGIKEVARTGVIALSRGVEMKVRQTAKKKG
ncbi:MAG: acetolactate synthase small subunit [Omnitrophica bacterium RIFCSPLOWO2_01_FULL_50_24]|nr:MAG: acetolactate synthase small subunit [Omnitrophica bacterium RIFCSPLOWO2_01_FULL_50_24]